MLDKNHEIHRTAYFGCHRRGGSWAKLYFIAGFFMAAGLSGRLA
ncbi:MULTISPECIES: hypothetical protein [Acinetobacter]